MKSDICKIMNDGRREEALLEAEKFADYCELSPKQSLHIRLLTEELIGILYGVTGTYKADFYLEKLEDKIYLHLESDTNLMLQERQQMLSVSSSGKNESAKGITGKIRSIYESYILHSEEIERIEMDNGILSMGMVGAHRNELSNHVAWSLNLYRGNVSKVSKQKKEEWDELEKSILANLADDVTVGIHFNKVEIIVTVNVDD